MFARFMPNGSLLWRVTPLLIIVIGAIFAFWPVELTVREWLSDLGLIIAILVLFVDGFLRFNGSQRGFKVMVPTTRQTDQIGS